MRDGQVGIEIERKYIIALPSVRDMQACEGYSRSEILQIYLKSTRGVTHRIRRRADERGVRYYETKKIRIDGMSAHEAEREISPEEFSSLSAMRDPERRPIEKVRHAFTYLGSLFEVDVYPEWRHTSILENELPDRERHVENPPFIRIIREVTGVEGYSNAAMALSFPPEENYL